jgi:hypothetical protein
MSWRDRIARFLRFGAAKRRRDGVRAWPADDIDPIEELDRLIGEAQERDAQEEGRLDDLARSDAPEVKRPPGACGGLEPNLSAAVRPHLGSICGLICGPIG